MSARARAEAKAASVYEPGAAVRGTAYVVTRLLGRGGMGAVYEVEHRLLGRKFVLKLLHAALAGKDDVVARMQNEWRTLGRLQHMNIVQVTDAGTTEDGLPYYVMERLEGEVLDAVLQRRRHLDPLEAVGITLDMLRGLAAAHGEHAIHRDIKPQNVFVTPAGAKLLDFGIAKLRDQALRVVTKAGVALGTPRYMAPEQAEGKAVDARTDIYATGLVLFEMLVGRGPFAHLKDAGELVLAQINEEPPRVDVLVPSIPEELGDFVQRLLAKSPESRPRTAALAERELSALVALLEQHAVRTEITAVGADPNERTLGAAVTTGQAAPDRAVPADLAPGQGPGASLQDPAARGLPTEVSLAPTESLPEAGTAAPRLVRTSGETRPRRAQLSSLLLLAALSVAVGGVSAWQLAPGSPSPAPRAEGAESRQEGSRPSHSSPDGALGESGGQEQAAFAAAVLEPAAAPASGAVPEPVALPSLGQGSRGEGVVVIPPSEAPRVAQRSGGSPQQGTARGEGPTGGAALPGGVAAEGPEPAQERGTLPPAAVQPARAQPTSSAGQRGSSAALPQSGLW